MLKKLFLPLCLLSGCVFRTPEPPHSSASFQEPLCRVNIIDCNGLSETITSKDRLKELAFRDFLSPQPFKKVLRIFAKNRQGQTKSVITSYYDNGHIHQYLECINNRANGLYKQWHPNGQQQLIARVCAGIADISEHAFASWSFTGETLSWNEQGTLQARYHYKNGLLQGKAEVFYPTGTKKQVCFYDNNMLEQTFSTFHENGILKESISYQKNKRHGPATGYHSNGSVSWKETYHQDALVNGEYFDANGTLLSGVSDSTGLRSLFDNDRLYAQQEITQGQPKGWTSLFSEHGDLERKFQSDNGKKTGLDFRYYPRSHAPKLCIEWKDGMLHGTVKSWFPNGKQESQREFCQNLRHGSAMAWYSDGSPQLVEEYEHDKLIRGQYYKKGESSPLSFVEKGHGFVTLFDDEGVVTERIQYADGKPDIP